MKLKIANKELVDYEYDEKVVISERVTRIGDFAFCNCKSLTSVVIPNSVTSIGYYAFSKCDSLTSIIIPNSVTSISDWAFYNCKRLVVRCKKGSYAERYCIENEIEYEAIDDMRSEELTDENYQKMCELMYKCYKENVLLKKELQKILDGDEFMELKEKIAKSINELNEILHK